jgi:hypothetical protein
VTASSIERERIRTINVSAINNEGDPVAATVIVTVRGIQVGSFTLNSEHTNASIDIAEEFGEVDLIARSGRQTLTAHLPVAERSHSFIFSIALTRMRTAVAVVAQARCADGRTGIPCVNCVVSGIPIRICV